MGFSTDEEEEEESLHLTNFKIQKKKKEQTNDENNGQKKLSLAEKLQLKKQQQKQQQNNTNNTKKSQENSKIDQQQQEQKNNNIQQQKQQEDDSEKEDFSTGIKLKKKVKNDKDNLAQKEEEEDLEQLEKIPKKLELQDTNAKNFYTHKGVQHELTREHLTTVNLRKFHNWIKSVLIQKYSNIQKKLIKQKFDLGYDNQLLFVLEIGCGQGGDVKKWHNADIGCWFGVDISGESLKEAKRRIDTMKGRKFVGFLKEEYGNAESDKFFSNIDDNVTFDLISAQFCINYMFDSQQSVVNLLTNMTKKLVNTGKVILTFPDAAVIVKKLREKGVDTEQGKKLYMNEHFAIEFDSMEFPIEKKYGLDYNFFLKDAVGEKDENNKITFVKEYLIELNNFILMAEEFNLTPVENKNFIEFYKDNCIEYKNLLKLMKFNFDNDAQAIEESLWDISHCYRVMVFEYKSKDKSKRIQNRSKLYREYSKYKGARIYEKTAKEIQEQILNKNPNYHMEGFENNNAMYEEEEDEEFANLYSNQQLNNNINNNNQQQDSQVKSVQQLSKQNLDSNRESKLNSAKKSVNNNKQQDSEQEDGEMEIEQNQEQQQQQQQYGQIEQEQEEDNKEKVDTQQQQQQQGKQEYTMSNLEQQQKANFGFIFSDDEDDDDDM